MLPQFIFIGPTKCGTTWVDAYLRSRNDVALPADLKETFFFDKQFDRGVPWYEGLFGNPPKTDVCVEVAPSLFAKRAAAENLKSVVPDAQVICILRDPVDRAVSHYFHYLKCGEPDVGFDRMASEHPDMIGSGVYYANILMWIELFGRDRVHVLLYDDMIADINGFCREICRILGLPYIEPARELTGSSVNEAGVPRFQLLAKLARGGADLFRRLGANKLVNALNGQAIKKIVFGPPPKSGHKGSIKEQARMRAGELLPDHAQLEALVGRKLDAWYRPRMPSEDSMAD